MQEGVLHGLDLFSGIGGITKALDGYVRPIAYCEIEPYARGVLLSRMADGSLPSAPIWDDICSLTADILPKIDIIYGGFPCQDISVAGRGVGLGGERSGLFFEIARLVGEIRPAFVFLENVPAIRTRGLGRVLKTMADLGYDCRWGALSAADVGANHKRERWFLLAHSQSQQNGRIRKSGVQSDIGTSGNVANSSVQSVPRTSERGTKRQESNPFRAHWWQVEPNVGRVANGVPKRVDRLRALGNSVVPAQVREAFERLMGL